MISVQEGIPLTDAKYLANDLTLETMGHIFRSANDSRVLMLEERYKALKETGSGIVLRTAPMHCGRASCLCHDSCET
jgi:hypothetical protein